MSFAADLRYGLRTLRKAPGFALTAAATMALGIGATTAIFGVADAMLWKPLPIPHLDTLVTILQRNPEDPHDYNGIAAADMADVAREATTVDGVVGWQDGLANIAGPGGDPERVDQYLVSSNFFEVIGVAPALGRGFVRGENEPGRERVVVLSDSLWRRRYGADPGVIGRMIRVDDEDYQIVGVAPRKFVFPKAAEIWTPYAFAPAQRANRRDSNVICAARLKAGHTLEQLSAEMDALGNRLAEQFPDTHRNRRFLVWGAHRFLVGEYNRMYVNLLFWAVQFVLLIACVNVANLQFARATGRLREVAVRTALGASRGQIVAQLVTESVLLSLGGAVVGLAIAQWGLDLIRAGMPAEVEKYIPGWGEIGLDGRAMLFTFLAALASGVLAGLAPAWQASRPNLTSALKEGGRTTAGRERHRFRSLLVAAEVALAVILLVGASLMVRGFRTLIQASTSMQPSTLLTLRLALTEKKYAKPHQRREFYRDVLQRAAAIPGVRAAVGATALPYSEHSSGYNYTIEGRPVDPARPIQGRYQTVTPGFFSTMLIPLRAGRFFDSHDGADSPRVAVVSEQMAQRYWPGESPVGKRIRIGSSGTGPLWTIVGVAGGIMHQNMEQVPRPVVYVPYDQDPRLWLDIALRTAGDPASAASGVIAAVRAVDSEQPVTQLRPMETLIHNQSLGLIYVAVLMGIFGGLALVLSCIGVYGVMAYLVQEQTHEIGIRMALGASRDSVLRMVLRRGMATTALGLGVGLIAALGLARLLQNLIFGVTSTDWVSFTGIPVALVAAAAVAILIPARRATRIDPIVALRYE